MLKTERYDLCLTDMQLPDGNGLELVSWMQQYSASVPVARDHSAWQYGNRGSRRSSSAPSTSSRSRSTWRAYANWCRRAIKMSENLDSDTSVFGPRLLGTSAAMQNMREMIGRVARSQAPVHIFGESGTGKELVAKLIHESGPRRDGPFVPVNCGAIPTELMESELFGHKRGSFTGCRDR